MNSCRRFLKLGVLLFTTGWLCSGSVLPAGPPQSGEAEKPTSASVTQETSQAAGINTSGKYHKIFPDVVATVNGAPVSGRDLEKAVSSEMAAIGNPDWKNLREDYRGNLVYNLLTGLINTKLMYAEAVAAGTLVTDAEVQDEYLRASKTFESDEEMNAFLAEQNIDSVKMVENIHQSLLISKYIDEAIRSKISVSDEEMQTFYAENPDQFEHPDLVRTSHIMIAAGKNQKESELAKQRIDDLMARLGKGEDFAALARENSMSPSASEGGDIGFAAREMMPPEYADAAFALPVGENRVVRTPEAYFIVKVTDKKEAGKSTLEDSRDQLAEFLVNEKVQTELHKKVNQLRNVADIEILIPAGVPLEP